MANKAQCRACLSTENKQYYSLLSVFPEFRHEGISILDMLSVVVSKISMDEQFPKEVCCECVKIIKEAYKFIILFTESQITLTKYSNNQRYEKSEVESEDEQETNVVNEIFGSDGCNDNSILEEESDAENSQGFQEVSDDLQSLDEIQTKENTYFCNKDNEHILEYNDISVNISDVSQSGIKPTSCTKRYTCEICSNDFDGWSIFNKHLKEKHITEWLEQYKCDICEYQCKDRKAYLYHIRKHEGKKFNCEHCDKIFLTKAYLKVHVATVHSSEFNNKYICGICKKGFKFKSALKYHMHSHTNEKNYTCQYCGFKSKIMQHAKRHERTHTGEKPYECSHCHKKFAGFANWQRHLHIHQGKINFFCQYCEKGFLQKYNMKVHMMQHTGSFFCEICGKGLCDGDTLKFHYMHTHKIKEKENIDGDLSA